MSKITVELIPFTSHFTPIQSGKYLVRTERQRGMGFTSVHHSEAAVNKCKDKEGQETYTIDVNVEHITHISKAPLS